MRKRDAFTLVELLTVIAVIAILAAISFGITTGVYQRQARTEAEAELAGIATALESYRKQYGTYPITSDEEEMLQALANRLKWVDESTTEEIDSGRPFLDPGKFDVSGLSDGDDFDGDGQLLVDPWGNEYQYEFSVGNSWKRFGYVLYSNGPDGTSVAPTNGIIDKDSAANADNIYIGE
tara:strand:- start:18807 stop:19343 length:537 start_codon:yes stop_codon:yes gene_type:complete